METKAPFDLNATIQRWRENLAQSAAFRAENLAELESHLRDSIARLQTAGLSAEEALIVAEKRIGRDGALEAEFKKINRQSIWLERFFWMLLGIQLSSFAVGAICMAGRGVLLFSLRSLNYDFSANHPLIRPALLFIGVNLAFFTGGLVVCWWLLRRKGKILGNWMAKLLRNRASSVATFCTIVLLSFLIRLTVISLPLKIYGNSRDMILVYGSSSLSYPLQSTALLALTLFVARKRFRTIKA